MDHIPSFYHPLVFDSLRSSFPWDDGEMDTTAGLGSTMDSKLFGMIYSFSEQCVNLNVKPVFSESQKGQSRSFVCCFLFYLIVLKCFNSLQVLLGLAISILLRGIVSKFR